jgi:methionine-rich copper-binding protein CopC
MPKSATKSRAALIAGLAAAWLVLASAPALAHANLVEASPPQGSEVSKPPEHVRGFGSTSRWTRRLIR